MIPVKPFLLASMTAAAAVVVVAAPVLALPLSPGDRVRVAIPADDQLPEDDRLNISGIYEINLDGNLQFPFVDPIPAAGLEIAQLEQRLARALVAKGLYRADILQVSLRVAQWAPVQVTVSGEVFQPGRVLINSLPIDREDERPQPRNQEIGTVSGEYPPERYLTAAIRRVGGIKPGADLRNVRLIRNGQEQVVNLAGVFSGESVSDIPLIAGDQVIVPQLETPQTALVRPSQLTPAQIPIIFSNLTEPARRGSEVLEVPYGTRFSQAVVMANCTGGNKLTNSRRKVALVQTDRLTGQTKILETSVERLIRNSVNSAENPYLMPQDSVVCYDSSVSTATGVLRVISDVFTPFFLIQRLFRGDD
jgi:polysaccharide biosynthesis/export protein